MSMQQYPFSPRTEFTEEELAAFLERERFLKERERALQRAMIEGRPIESVDAPQPVQEQPAPSTPVEQPEAQPQQPQQQSRLGLTVPLTDQDILLESYRVLEQQAQENLESTLPQDILEKRQKETAQRMLERSVTPEGTDIGTFGESDLLLHTDGYVVGEDGKPRKASGAEILMQGFGRQALYRGAEYDKRLAEINATREMKLAELKAQGMSDIEARENVDAWYSGQLTEVDKQNRDIRETWLASIMRQMGLGSAALEEVVFDEMPLFYEVDEQGNPTNLDSWADSLAYTIDTARKAGSEAAGVDLAEWGRSNMATAVRANPLTAGPAAISDAILRGYGKSLPDLMPVPFSPIDREAQTTSAERGRRAAANTGGFAGDVGMAWSRGRSFHDGLMAIPSYRNQLGDAQWMSLIPAMGVEIGLPGGPLDIGLKSMKGAKLLAKTGVLGKTLQAAADIGNAAQWEASHRLVAELGEMIDDTGNLDVATMAATHGDPARVVAANTAREMATPFKLQALARDELTTIGELEGAARTSEVGRHILDRVYEAGVLSEVAEGTDLLSEAQRQAVDMAVMEWRLGVEARTIERELMAGGALAKTSEEALNNAVLNTVGKRGHGALHMSDLYEEARTLAKEGASARDVATAYRRAAQTAGSAPIRSDHRIMRMLLSLSDETAAVGARNAFNVVHPLAANMGVVGDLPVPSPGLRYGAGLERAWRHTLNEVVDAHMPRNVRFVTDRLMVPVAKLTEANTREVGAMERALYNPTFEDGVYKLPENADPNAIMGRVLSVLPGAVGKRPELVDPIRNALFDGALDVKQHAFVSDALKEAGWRDLLGDVATTPTMASRQTERAVARQRFKADVLDPTIDTVHAMVRAAATGPTKAMHALFAAMPESVVSRKILGTLRRYNEAWDQRLVSKWLVTGNPQRPQALQRTTELIANDVALVQRQYRQELRATVAAARREGAEVPGAAALDAMAKRRWNRVARSAVDDFYRDVDRLAQASRENALKEPMRREPTKMEFIALTLYRTGRARTVNIGKLLEDLRAMSPDKQAKFVEMAESMVARDAYMQQWRNIMRDFFTRSASRKQTVTANLLKKIDQQLETAVQADQAGADAVEALLNTPDEVVSAELLGVLDDVAKSVMLEPSPSNIQTVIDRLRKALPVDLRGRGAGVGNPLTGYRDASLETGQLWQMSVDEQFAIAARVQDLINTNPELLVRLTPSVNEMTSVSIAARQFEYQAPVATAKQVVWGLAIMAEDAGVTVNEALYNAALRQLSTAGGAMAEAVGAMPGIKKSGVLYNITRYTRNRIKSLSNKERLAMADQSLRAMMQRKTLYPGATGLQTIKAGGTSGKKDAAFAYGQKIVELVIEGQRQPDAASKFIADTIGQMLGSGVAKHTIEDRIVKDTMAALDDVFGSYIENEVRNTMRRWGFSSFSAPGSLERIAQTLIETPVDKAYAFTPVPGMEDIFEKLHSYAANGRLLPLLDSLHGRTMLKEEAYGEYLWSLLGDFVEAGRQTSAYGLLSGGLVLGGPTAFVPVMLPLFRYIGLNLLTAPGMMMGTLGAGGAAKALGYAAAEVGRGLGDVGRKVASKLRGRSALVNTVAPDAPDSIVFRDVYGKQWTRREFDELCEMWNSYMSRAEVDQTYNVLRTMQRELGVVAKRAGGSADLKGAHWFRQATRFVNPFFESPGMQFAVYTDTVFRRGAFASAIRDGHTAAQAAEIAKASVLDYGAIPDLVKTTANKYLLFATFRAASMKEILQSVFAGRDEWMRVMRVQMQLHKAAETWTFGADHDKVRAFTIPGPEFDYRPTAIAGQQEVFASGAADIVQATFFAAAVAAAAMDDKGESSAGDILGRLVTGIEEENIQPFAQMLIAMVVNKRPTSRGRLVNDVWVSALQSAGMWDWAVERYEIKDINPAFHAKEMRPGAPTFKGSQFVFTGNGYRQFQVDTFAATNLMFNRSTQDIYKALAGSPYPAGEGYDPKYRAIVPYYFYLPGLATPIRLKSPEDIYQRALNQDIYR